MHWRISGSPDEQPTNDTGFNIRSHFGSPDDQLMFSRSQKRLKSTKHPEEDVIEICQDGDKSKATKASQREKGKYISKSSKKDMTKQ